MLSDNGASSEGGPTGSLNDVRPWNLAAAPGRRGARAHRRDRRPALPQQLPVGLDGRRQHAVPALEARGARGRRRRSADRALAARASPRAARCAASTCTRSTSCRRCSTCVGVDAAGRRSTASRSARSRARASRTTFDDADAPEPRTTRSTTRCSAAARSTTTAGRRSPTTRSRIDEPGFDDDAWELYDVDARPVRVPRPRRRAAREAARADRALVGARPSATRCCRSTTAPFSELVLERPSQVAAARALRLLPGHGARCPRRSAVNVRNRSHAITAEVEIPAGGAEGVLLAQGSLLGGWSLFVQRRPPALRAQLRRPRGAPRVVRGRRLDAGPRTRSRSASPAPASTAASARCSSTASSSARRRSRASRRRASRSPAPASPAGTAAALPVTDDYDGPFPFTGTLERVVVEVDGAPFVDPAGEAAVAIATQ